MKNYIHKYLAASVPIIALVASGATVHADTAAYWRHEGGPNGTLIPAGPDSVLDSSGNGNHMQTFNPAFTSATYSSTVSPRPLQSGLANTLSLDFGPGGDDAGLNDDNFTANKPVQTRLFSAMTLELAFNMNSVGGYQALFGKDGKPLGDGPGEDDSPIPTFKMMIRGDDFPGSVPNQLFVEFVDGDGTLNSDSHFLSSGITIAAGQWYHVALTLSGSAAELWVAGETGSYTLLDSITGDFAGLDGRVLADDAAGFSIGRGMFNNGVADWADAKIDEVRISDMILTPDQFLFAPVPEPSVLVLGSIGGLALLVSRRSWSRTRASSAVRKL